MRKIPIPAVVLCLLSPVIALAQAGLGHSANDLASGSPTVWFWLISGIVALVAWIVSTAVVSRRNWPPTRRRTV